MTLARTAGTAVLDFRQVPGTEGEARFNPDKVKTAFKEVQAKIVRWNILDTKSRIDGRDLVTVRRFEAAGFRAWPAAAKRP